MVSRAGCVAVACLVAVVLVLVAIPKGNFRAPQPAAGTAFVLRNTHGVEVHLLSTGASIQRLLLPDRHGALADVALGFEEEEPYADGRSPYFGAIAGRFANRIANATFKLDGKAYRLPRNEAGFPGSLHGGRKGFDKVSWKGEHLPQPLTRFQKLHRRGDAVRFRYASVDGEEGYPGALDVEVVYTLTDSARGRDDARTPLAPGGYCELIQSITATVTGAPTVINLAQHSYFNLAGHASGTVLEHELTLPTATRVLPVDGHRIPTGHLKPVQGSPFDFLRPSSLGARIAEVDGPGWRAGYDNCFVLHGLGDAPPALKDSLGSARGGKPPPAADAGWWLRTPRLAATLSHRASGRTMEVLTNAPGLQLYTSNFLDASRPIPGTKDGARYGRYGGVCLETQSFPDGPSHVNSTLGMGAAATHARAASRSTEPRATYPTGVLRPGEKYRHLTIYRFSVS